MAQQYDDPIDNPIIYFESEMMRLATPEQIEEWEQMPDYKFCELQAAYSKRRLEEYGGKAKWLRDRDKAKLQKALDKSAITAVTSPSVTTQETSVMRDRVGTHFAQLSRAGKRGAAASAKARLNCNNSK